MRDGFVESSECIKTVSVLSPEGKQIIESLKTCGDLTLFVGSAISQWQPTSIPTGMALSWAIIELLTSVLDINSSDLITNLIAKVPFEYLCEQCPDQSLLQTILTQEFYPREPNDVHKMIGDLVKTGMVGNVITTNYDDCLEAILPNNKPLKHVVTKSQASTVLADERILFKIHGSAVPKQNSTMVFSLKHESVLPKWKRELLYKCLRNQTMLSIGYSGLDFEICPEIPSAKPARLIWNSFGDPDDLKRDRHTLSENARRVLVETSGIALLGDMKDLFARLLTSRPLLKGNVSNFAEKIKERFSPKQIQLWASGVFAFAGFGHQAEAIARHVLASSSSLSEESALAFYFLAEALFWKGKYFQSAAASRRSQKLCQMIGREDLLFDSLTREIDALRCAGLLDDAWNLAEKTKKTFESPVPEAQVRQSRIDLLQTMILRERYVRAKAHNDSAKMNLFRERGKRLLQSCTSTMADFGRWHDLQTCRLWANRLDIPFREVYNGPLQPLQEWFGYRHLGHIVGEMVAARDSLAPPHVALANEKQLANYIALAREIGCCPEVWKQALAIKRYFGKNALIKTNDWLWAFFQCEYTLSMRWFKLRYAEYR